MSEQNDPKVDVAIIRDFEARIKAATTDAEKKALTKEAMDYINSTGVTIPVESLETTAKFAAQVVDGVLESIIRTAQDMGSPVVPIEFIEQLRPLMPDYISKSLLGAAVDIGVPIGYADGVPDDLSGVEL